MVEAAATAASATLTINGIGNYSFAGNLTGALSLVKSGSGTQIFGGTNNSTGSTMVSGGVLEFTSTNAMPATLASITVTSGGTVADGTTSGLSQSLITRVVGSSTGTVALAANSSNSLNFNNLTASLGSTGSYAYSGVLTPNGTNYNLGGGGGLLTISSMLSGGNSLTVLNGGDVAPAVANTYTGGTIIDSGTTLLISSDGSSGSAAELGLVPTSATTNITINGGTLQATSTFALNANRGIALGSSGGTIDVDGITSNNSNTLTYNGVITGAGSLALTDTGTLVLGGLNMYSGGTNISSGTLRAGIADTIPQSSAVTLGLGGTLQLNGFSQSIGSLTGGGVVTDNSSTSTTLTVGNDNTSPAAFYGVISDTNTGTTGTLALNKVGSGTLTLTGLNTYSGGTTVNGGTLIVAAAPSLAKNSQLVVNSGTLQFNVTSGTATVQSGVTATVAPAATLQLAGSVSAFSDGSAISPTDGQLVNVNNNGSTASGGGLSVTGTNQSVGTITGTVTSSPSAATTYSGDTVVGAGASLTATQILQNTLTIGAGATVTIRPSGSGIATNDASDATSSVADSTGAAPVSGTALEIENIQNRIAVLEQLEATDSSSNASPLDETPATLVGATSSVPNPANANLTSDSEASLLASEIATLQNRENLLLAEENSSSELGTLATAFSSTDVPAGGVGVPEPSGLLLTLTGAVAVALTLLARRGRRFSLAQAFYTCGIDRCGHRPFQRSRD
jgi:autotransporter-associated beta strand protein